MKVEVCDVCYHEGNAKKLSNAKWKSSLKKPPAKITISLCEDHKEYLKGLSYDAANDKITKLYMG